MTPSRPEALEFRLATPAELRAWEGLTPVSRQALAWEQGAGVGQSVETPEMATIAQAWSRLVRLVHAVLTHPAVGTPAGMGWTLGVRQTCFFRPRPGDADRGGWSLCLESLIPAAPGLPGQAPPLPEDLSSARKALLGHALVQLCSSDVGLLLPGWGVPRALPFPSASPDDLRTWWGTVERRTPALSRFAAAAAAGELAAALPASQLPRVSPRL